MGYNQPVYSSTPPFEVIVEYYKDDVIQVFKYDTANQMVDINFTLEKVPVVVDEPISTGNVSITVEVSGINGSVNYLSGGIISTLDDNAKIYTYTEKIGNEVSISSSDLGSYVIS